ncbi:hypothetical protein BU25DRAFT_411890 [Macroventuria anomochaeta]|uniref:Uncharacterized protein n=1 Tax=Macroventuria anomochaeta TaxID=301207 RepID=A0ACB6RXR0_9PLEO|nr:uncharacterized protein BU25DRAFT_411890 [Macroventuria anomochaeta]KAF2626492.1 hypothetical protein BU25DRAFT_411890 [Macroventuria anomochaeta]
MDPSSECIRLLDLLLGHDDEPVSFKLRIGDLLDINPNPYEALSYCWGEWNSDNVAKVQHIDDQRGTNTVHVSPSLCTALTHLRDGSTKRTLWVDQFMHQSIKQGRGCTSSQKYGQNIL